MLHSDTKMVPWDASRAQCACNVCRCKCSLYFPRSKWQLVELQTRQMRQEKEKKRVKAEEERDSKQQTLHQVLGITQKAMNQNGFASAGLGILTNEEINQDIAARAQLQMNLPSPTRLLKHPSTGETVSINKLRSEKKRGIPIPIGCTRAVATPLHPVCPHFSRFPSLTVQREGTSPSAQFRRWDHPRSFLLLP